MITKFFNGLVILQPADVRISRTATIAGLHAVVFDQVNDLHKHQASRGELPAAATRPMREPAGV